MTEKRKGLSWGVGIWLLYGGFVLFILACVGFASMQSFDLVEDNYYKKGIEYQGQIDKIDRTRALAVQPKIRLNQANAIEIVFPESFSAEKLTGSATLYRPSNSQYDKQVSLDGTRQVAIPMGLLPTGLWKVKLDWQYDGQSYYSEETIIIE